MIAWMKKKKHIFSNSYFNNWVSYKYTIQTNNLEKKASAEILKTKHYFCFCILEIGNIVCKNGKYDYMSRALLDSVTAVHTHRPPQTLKQSPLLAQ